MQIFLSLVFLFVATAAILAEENRTVSPAAKPITNRKALRTTDEQPEAECAEEVVDGKSGFYCYQTVNGQRGRYGIRVFDKNNYYCGEFQNNRPNGKGYFYYGNPEENKNYCGDVVNGKAHGYGSNQFFAKKKLQMGRYVDNVSDGVTIVYFPERDISARAEYKRGMCKSSIWYDSEGKMTERLKTSCKIPKRTQS